MSVRQTGALVAGLMTIQAVLLHLLGRVWVCSCGTVRLWVGDIHSSEVSQQILDLYTPSHVIHGMIFYGVLHLLLPRVPVRTRMLVLERAA